MRKGSASTVFRTTFLFSDVITYQKVSQYFLICEDERMYRALSVRLVNTRASPKSRSRNARANRVRPRCAPSLFRRQQQRFQRRRAGGLRRAPLETLSLSDLASRQRVTSCGTIFSIVRQGSGCRVWHLLVTSLPPLCWTTFPKYRRKTPNCGEASSSPFGTSRFRVGRRRGNDWKDAAVASGRSVSARHTLMQGRHT